ncbi:hypothetical protein BKA82DRAFT_4353563 [Pisolithus tinctorius]|nr:hypothetical protein BKA82DRAFT_4353563 [Pisolithus tinctorius]
MAKGRMKQVNAHSVVQEIKELQAELDATKDEDEQRALEEDVTGKILWLFWQAHSAVFLNVIDMVQIVNYIERESNLMGLWEIGEIIRGTFRTDPDDDQVHLRRIMADAGAGTSKHQLWLAARAAQLMNRSGVTAAEDQFNLDTPTAFPRTSHQMPSASLASIP